MSRPPQLPRLFAATDASLAAHLTTFGELPVVGAGLVEQIDEADLSGRGGAGFPAALKMAAITGRRPVVVGNGAEGEPLSRKDAALLARAPHLVLDGLDAAAAALNADEIYLYVHPDAITAVTAALDERRAADMNTRQVDLIEAPDRFVAGEESAVIRRIEGGPALPRDRTVVSALSGVKGRPTLVNNVETLAHIALIARFGPQWFRAVGEPDEPGTMLVTLSGALHRHGVVEVPTGTLLSSLIETSADTDPRSLAAILVGGYHGSWLPAGSFAGIRLSRTGLTALGASPGAGIVHALGSGECGLARTAEITRYLADQSARQCGPCLNGLPRLADLVEQLAHGRVDDRLVQEIRRLARVVDGRGSCRHPDGTARMVRSTLRAFARDIELHAQQRCTAAEAIA